MRNKKTVMDKVMMVLYGLSLVFAYVVVHTIWVAPWLDAKELCQKCEYQELTDYKRYLWYNTKVECDNEMAGEVQYIHFTYNKWGDRVSERDKQLQCYYR